MAASPLLRLGSEPDTNQRGAESTERTVSHAPRRQPLYVDGLG